MGEGGVEKGDRERDLPGCTEILFPWKRANQSLWQPARQAAGRYKRSIGCYNHVLLSLSDARHHEYRQ